MSRDTSRSLRHVQAVALAAYRLVIGFLFACHGASTLFGLPDARMRFHGPVGEWPHWWGGVIELVGGVLVAAGCVTRGAAFLCSGTMAFAYFTVHAHKGLFPIANGGEAAVLFCWSFFVLVFLGPGAPSIDGLVGARLRGGARRSVAASRPGVVDVD
ncbi:DoxX family protein [Tsukamurella soli]|uniref:Oxidoreductase n=1 Tax=Tsukamurella soli TaxID=644556 RepID=A0ABP8JQQ8_9ACTN